MTNEEAIDVFKIMKRQVLADSREDKVLDIAIKALKYKPIILQEHDAEPRTMRAILDVETNDIYILETTKGFAKSMGMTIEGR